MTTGGFSEEFSERSSAGFSPARRRTLDELLMDNYWNKRPEAECVQRVISYVAKTESVAGKDIDSIKRLTVVAQNVYEANPTILGWGGKKYLEKIYRFNHEGLQEIQQARSRGLDYNHTDPRKAAVSYAYAESTAKSLAKMAEKSRRDEAGQKEWLGKAQECYLGIQRLLSAGGRYAYKMK